MIEAALKAFASGKLVAIPTETVYGLAAPINNPESIKKIFSIKERPFFDPLIVHVSSISQAKTLTNFWSPLCEILTKEFWPGPLTLVLPKTKMIDPMITSGLETVGVRWPKHELTQRLIEKIQIPLAAPSANKFGKTSPTSADHVRSEFSANEVFVLDGGPCEGGIESTVLSVQENGDLTLLRAGLITKTQIKDLLEKQGIKFCFLEPTDKKMAPGQMKHHYMPAIPLVLVSKEPLSEQKILQAVGEKLNSLPEEIEGVRIVRPQKMTKAIEICLPEDSRLAARLFYAELRSKAQSGADLIYIYLKPYFHSEEWKALYDRMSKAASLTI